MLKFSMGYYSQLLLLSLVSCVNKIPRFYVILLMVSCHFLSYVVAIFSTVSYFKFQLFRSYGRQFEMFIRDVYANIFNCLIHWMASLVWIICVAFQLTWPNIVGEKSSRRLRSKFFFFAKHVSYLTFRLSSNNYRF